MAWFLVRSAAQVANLRYLFSNLPEGNPLLPGSHTLVFLHLFLALSVSPTASSSPMLGFSYMPGGSSGCMAGWDGIRATGRQWMLPPAGLSDRMLLPSLRTSGDFSEENITNLFAKRWLQGVPNSISLSIVSSGSMPQGLSSSQVSSFSVLIP